MYFAGDIYRRENPRMTRFFLLFFYSRLILLLFVVHRQTAGLRFLLLHREDKFFLFFFWSKISGLRQSFMKKTVETKRRRKKKLVSFAVGDDRLETSGRCRFRPGSLLQITKYYVCAEIFAATWLAHIGSTFRSYSSTSGISIAAV